MDRITKQIRNEEDRLYQLDLALDSSVGASRQEYDKISRKRKGIKKKIEKLKRKLEKSSQEA